MKLKLVLLGVFLTTCFAFAQLELPPPEGGQEIYVIRPGDTLWDISKRFFKNPFLWPRLWELNPYIDDPNLIYPGEVLVLKPPPPRPPRELPVVKIEPETEIKPIPPPIFFYSRGGSEGFIYEKEWESMGAILASPKLVMLLGEGDTVYVNVGLRDEVKRGDRFTVFRSSKEVLHPVTGLRIGYKVLVLGDIEITEVLGDRLSIAHIDTSYREITSGARIKPYEPVVKEVALKRGKWEVEGYVVENLNNLAVNAQGDIVYIDLGSMDGIVPGNTVSVYKPDRRVFDPDLGTSVIIPGIEVGKIVILRVQRKSSTGFIIESSKEIVKGNRVRVDLKFPELASSL